MGCYTNVECHVDPTDAAFPRKSSLESFKVSLGQQTEFSNVRKSIYSMNQEIFNETSNLILQNIKM